MQQLVEESLTVQQAARLADRHPITIYRWIYGGILQAKKTKTGRYRIAPKELKAVLEPPDEEQSEKGEKEG